VTRRVATATAALATAFAVVGWLSAAGVDPFSFGMSPPFAATYAGVAVSAVATVAAWGAARSAPGLALALSLVMLAWLATAMQVNISLPPEAIAALAAAGALGLLGGAALLGRRATAVVAGPAAWAFVMHLLGYQPFRDPACFAPCAQVAAPLADAWGARAALGTSVAGSVVALALVCWFAAVSHGPLPVRAVAVVTAAAFAVAEAAPWWRWGASPATPVPEQIRSATVILVTALVALAVLRRWRARRALEALVRQLGSGARASVPGVVAVHAAVPGTSRWVDEDGHDVPEGVGMVLTGADGVPAVRLVGERGSPDLAATITPAVRLALDNARLDLVAKVRVADLRASQGRIVATADAERHRIESDLHDGAQQRLVGAALHLAAAAERLEPPDDEDARQVGALVSQALAGLRLISHGALLAVLGTEGLQAAVEDVTDSAGVPLDTGLVPALDASVERAAYAVVTAGLAAGGTSVRLGASDGLFVVHVAGPLAGDGLDRAADRVGATGGTLRIDNLGVTGAWPCAS
jgi:signal transduction histidine kinase